MSAKGSESPRTWADQHWTHRKPELLRRGERHPAAKLTAADVGDIRRWYAAGMSMTKLAKLALVNRETISRIVHRKTWRHVG